MSNTSGHSGGYEKRDINVKKVVRDGLICVVLIIIAVVAVDQWFLKTKEELYKEMVLQPPNQELLQIRAREDSLSVSYGIADSTGAIRIPVDSAIAIIASEAASGMKKK